MNDNQSYRNLRFDPRIRPIPRKLIPVIAVPFAFTAVWLLLSPGAVFWLSLILVTILAWISTFGWDEALANFIRFLQRHQ